jgi:hypothetical protein
MSKETHQKFINYVINDWPSDTIHTLRTLADLFDIPLRNVRYHAIKLVDEGYLCQIKFDGNTYYLLKRHYAEFLKFRPYGVQVK